MLQLRFSQGQDVQGVELQRLPPEQEADFLELNEAQELADQVAAARRLGYAMLDTEDLLNVACAIVDEKDFPFATLSLTVPLFRVGPGDRPSTRAEPGRTLPRQAAPQRGRR